MGFRGAIKKGGGFLNNVDGVLQSYSFEKKFKGEKKDGEWCYFVPTILVDGADDPIDQHLFIGANDRYEVSDDGQELTMADESPVSFGHSTPFGKLMDSLCEKGFPEDELPDIESGEPLNLTCLVGRRFRFKQEVDVEATKKLGKRVSGVGKGKREYDRTNTVIEAVLDTKSGASGKPNGSGKKVKNTEDDLKTEAADVLRDVLVKGDVSRKNLALPIARALIKNTANRDALKAIILDEEWQDEQEWLDVTKGVLSLA